MILKVDVFRFLYCLVLFCLFACNGDGELPLRCSLAPEVGPCDALIPRYYFDSKENECKQFDWGGCDGVVPFDTLEECEECVSSGG
ncbi:proteinase inhibitor I4 serpin [Flavobacteriaceae bacterium TP-CH-4]|uniref:Proteinase inhibitor I4 serpin n=1 Tax=Pelagihabitans pacificus TaxID=2696054 RepID=A0A967AYF4_9FLAO|nr:BPTI/Kunitz domain-containing protein [Pelagihabitans pacificus]NHF61483.1 proteinase inhibitor I4 serpin [Pelagihabitans pacificus]